jgi:hypothetical protein
VSGEAVVLRVERVGGDDGHGADVVIDPSGQPITAPHYAAPGVDALPLPGDFVALAEGAGAGAELAVGYADTSVAGLAQPGEIRLYCRNAGGATVSSIWLKGDGTVVITATGNITINGVTITPAGAITAPGEVTAMAVTPATAVKLSTHLHPTALGPSGSPTPGS